MPDQPSVKITPAIAPQRWRRHDRYFAEFLTSSNFSFLSGASHPEELVGTARDHGYASIALADEHSLAGIVRGYRAATESGIPYRVGARCVFVTASGELTVGLYPHNRRGYGALCSLLTVGKQRMPAGGCFLALSDLTAHQHDLSAIIIPPSFENAPEEDAFIKSCALLKECFSTRDALSMALRLSYAYRSARQVEVTTSTARALTIPLIATTDAHYHHPTRKPLHDVLTCIRHHTTLPKAGFLLEPNSERHIKPIPELYHLFREFPEALRRTAELSERTSSFSLAELRYEYPNEICPPDQSPAAYLKALVMRGAAERFPEGIPETVQNTITTELALIAELHYEKYFLTCYDILAFARSQNILCQGRGAAANSVVCYCLGLTAVDPTKIELLFARFVSKARDDPPDIDLDFEHERRDKVIQYIYQRYGRHRAALAAAVITYRARSAVREVSKAFGLPAATVDSLASLMHHWTGNQITPADLTARGLDPKNATIRHILDLSQQIIGFPRHLSQHVGGFIISAPPLSELVPIRNATMPGRTIIEWDKDDLETLGLLKVDILALGMLSCIRKTIDRINIDGGHQGKPLTFATIPSEDPAVYEQICQSDTVGVFQIESRAQMSMLPRLQPRCFYDLVIEVAIVRPGPIHGDMVHPYLRRRAGLESVHYPDERVREILGKTLGVPIFQEQAMRLAIVLANFSPEEADRLRRALASWKHNKQAIAQFQDAIVAGMEANSYSRRFAETCINQMKGFSEYGFPESHAASFALITYASAWLKRHYPVHFAAALINSQPMGFYQPAQICRDLQAHGQRGKDGCTKAFRVLPIDISKSEWDCTVEGPPDEPSLRLGFRLITGLAKEQAEIICAARARFGMRSIREFWLEAKAAFPDLHKNTLLRIARADGYLELHATANNHDSAQNTRRLALWELCALPGEVLQLDGALDDAPENKRSLPAECYLPHASLQDEMNRDYETTNLSLRAHPLQFLRPALEKKFVKTAQELRLATTGLNKLVSVAGIVIVKQRPHTAKGVVFMTIEDETGIVNLVLKPAVWERHQDVVLFADTVLAHGVLERTSPIVYINVTSISRAEV